MQPGDEVVSLAGRRPRDVIEWRLLADEADVDMEVRRGGLDFEMTVAKAEGESLGAEVSSALFDKVRTWSNSAECTSAPSATPAALATVTLRSRPPRRISSSGSASSASSCHSITSRGTRPARERISSPGCSPARAAGDPGATAPMRGGVTGQG